LSVAVGTGELPAGGVAHRHDGFLQVTPHFHGAVVSSSGPDAITVRRGAEDSFPDGAPTTVSPREGAASITIGVVEITLRGADVNEVGVGKHGGMDVTVGSLGTRFSHRNLSLLENGGGKTHIVLFPNLVYAPNVFPVHGPFRSPTGFLKLQFRHVPQAGPVGVGLAVEPGEEIAGPVRVAGGVSLATPHDHVAVIRDGPVKLPNRGDVPGAQLLRGEGIQEVAVLLLREFVLHLIKAPESFREGGRQLPFRDPGKGVGSRNVGVNPVEITVFLADGNGGLGSHPKNPSVIILRVLLVRKQRIIGGTAGARRQLFPAVALSLQRARFKGTLGHVHHFQAKDPELGIFAGDFLVKAQGYPPVVVSLSVCCPKDHKSRVVRGDFHPRSDSIRRLPFLQTDLKGCHTEMLPVSPQGFGFDENPRGIVFRSRPPGAIPADVNDEFLIHEGLGTFDGQVGWPRGEPVEILGEDIRYPWRRLFVIRLIRSCRQAAEENQYVQQEDALHNFKCFRRGGSTGSCGYPLLLFLLLFLLFPTFYLKKVAKGQRYYPNADAIAEEVGFSVPGHDPPGKGDPHDQHDDLNEHGFQVVQVPYLEPSGQIIDGLDEEFKQSQSDEEEDDRHQDQVNGLKRLENHFPFLGFSVDDGLGDLKNLVEGIKVEADGQRDYSQDRQEGKCPQDGAQKILQFQNARVSGMFLTSN
jgi:hypothetical protein